jgi:type III pantothenate kinase
VSVLLVCDVGNTEITLALFDGERLARRGRLRTHDPRDAAQLVDDLRDFVGADPVARCAIASVVPTATEALVRATPTAIGTRARILDATGAWPITIAVDEPAAVGVDRLVNCAAAHLLHRCDTIVVDLGTATTYDCVTAEGRFLGGAIAPGVRTSLDALVGRTAQLRATPLEAPPRAIGTRTDLAIRAGVVFGAVDALEGMVRRLAREWPGGAAPLVIATGGLAATVAPLCPSVGLVDPELTLTGIRLVTALRGD